MKFSFRPLPQLWNFNFNENMYFIKAEAYV